MFKKVQESIKLKSSTLHSMNFLHEITCNFLNRNVETKKSDLKKCRTIIDLVPRLYFRVLKIPVENELISIFKKKKSMSHSVWFFSEIICYKIIAWPAESAALITNKCAFGKARESKSLEYVCNSFKFFEIVFEPQPVASRDSLRW